MSTEAGKYINPLTDFGFKRLFEAAEIAKFTPEEREAYEESLKYYRDIKNVVDTSREEGLLEGLEKKTLEFAKKMKEKKEPIEKIMEYTGLSREDIEKL
jgi:predicted transposase/invertase (TIGR01784 family)